MSESALNIVHAELRCNKCGETKPLSDFWADNRRMTRGRQYRNHYCKECLKASRRTYDLLADDDPRILSGVRVCNECDIEKGLQFFARARLYPMGRELRCKECKNKWAKSRRPERRRKPPIQPTARDYRRLKFLGVTANQFRDLYDLQNGLCGVCNEKMGYLAKETCIDHDHKTGLVRGILCQRCNLGLGHMRDNVGLLCSAIMYLEKHRKP